MDMLGASLPLLLLVAAIVCAPFLVRWMQQRRGRVAGTGPAGDAVQVRSAAAVGPQQRVVTVEAGPAHARVCLVLGVTPSQVSLLHSAPLHDDADPVSLPRGIA